MERLQAAAVELFLERGYGEVTVAEIADRAGLTKRTFFNYFADKREVLFASAEAFEASIVQHLADASDDLSPIDAAVAALTRGGLELSRYGDSARIRRELIASSSDLQERNLIKMASLAAAIAAGLTRRQIPTRIAGFTAQAAVAIFSTAYDDWADDTTADFSALMQRALSDLRLAIGNSAADSASRTGSPQELQGSYPGSAPPTATCSPQRYMHGSTTATPSAGWSSGALTTGS